MVLLEAHQAHKTHQGVAVAVERAVQGLLLLQLVLELGVLVV
jgi:hypothetical protein